MCGKIYNIQIYNMEKAVKKKESKSWNGGTTNEYSRMIRESEDYHDTIDSELTDRESLSTRQKIMNKTRLPHDKTPKVKETR